MKPTQLLVEIPSSAKSWPFPWFASKIEGYNSINTGKVKVGDYVFIDDNEINDISHTSSFDSDGTPTEYSDFNSYAIFNVEGEYGDCVGDPVQDYISVFRRKS
jgi:hypothetical protein